MGTVSVTGWEKEEKETSLLRDRDVPEGSGGLYWKKRIAGKEGKVSMANHLLGEVFENWDSLILEVTEHGI